MDEADIRTSVTSIGVTHPEVSRVSFVYRPSSSKETGRRLRHRRQAREDLASCETSSSLRSDWEVQMQLTHEHEELRRTYRRVIEEEINPHVNEWEAAQIFPAHEVFKKLGRLGLLGVTKPIEYGGLGLDYSYGAIIDETSQYINCGGIPMAIGVQTDMATPALARFGSPQLCREFLAPAIAGDMVCCIGVTEPSAGSDVAAIKTRAVQDGDDYVINGSKTFITNGTQADWMCMLANTGEGPVHRNKSLIIVPLKEGGKRGQGCDGGEETEEARHACLRYGRTLFRGRSGPGGKPDRRRRQRIRLSNEAVSGRANVRGARLHHQLHALDRRDDRIHAQPQGFWSTDNRKPGRPLSPVRTPDRSGGVARVDLEGRGDSRVRRRLHPVRFNGEAQGNTAGARSPRRVSAILGRHGIYG